MAWTNSQLLAVAVTKKIIRQNYKIDEEKATLLAVKIIEALNKENLIKDETEYKMIWKILQGIVTEINQIKRKEVKDGNV